MRRVRTRKLCSKLSRPPSTPPNLLRLGTSVNNQVVAKPPVGCCSVISMALMVTCCHTCTPYGLEDTSCSSLPWAALVSSPTRPVPSAACTVWSRRGDTEPTSAGRGVVANAQISALRPHPRYCPAADGTHAPATPTRLPPRQHPALPYLRRTRPRSNSKYNQRNQRVGR